MERKEKSLNKITLVFFILFSLWCLLQILTPFYIPNKYVNDLSGLTLVVDNKENLNTLHSPWNYIYSIGDIMCHQKASRSFYIKGNQMPFCCRCTGIWLGITLGLGLTILYRFHENKKYMFLIALGFLPLLVDGFGQLFGFWVSTNLTRFFTGIFAGCVCGIALGIIFEELTQLISIKKYFIKN